MLKLDPISGGESIEIPKQHALPVESCGPRPIGLFVPHSTGWFLFRLSPLPDVLAVNDEPLTLSAGVRLRVGDKVRLGRKDFRVTAADPDRARTFPRGRENTACTLLLGTQHASLRAGEVLLLGTAPHCGIRLSPGAAPVQAVVAWVAGRWVVHNASQKKFTLPNGDRVRCYPLTDGDSINLGADAVRVEIALSDELAPAADEPDPLPLAEELAPEGTASEEGVPEESVAEEGVPEPAAPPAPVRVRPAPRAADTIVGTNDRTQSVPPPLAPVDPLFEPAKRVCDWLKAVHKEPGREIEPPKLPARAGLRGLFNADAAFIERFHEVVGKPRDVLVLLGYAQALERREFPGLHISVLRRLFFLDPTSAPVARLLAEALLRAATASGDKRARVTYLTEATGYLRVVLERGNESPEVTRLGRDIDAELLGAKLSHSGGEGGTP